MKLTLAVSLLAASGAGLVINNQFPEYMDSLIPESTKKILSSDVDTKPFDNFFETTHKFDPPPKALSAKEINERNNMFETHSADSEVEEDMKKYKVQDDEPERKAVPVSKLIED